MIHINSLSLNRRVIGYCRLHFYFAGYVLPFFYYLLSLLYFIIELRKRSREFIINILSHFLIDYKSSISVIIGFIKLHNVDL